MLRVGGSPRGWFNEFVTENNLESGGKDCRSTSLDRSLRARRLLRRWPGQSGTRSSRPAVQLAFAFRIACEGMLPAETRSNVNSIRGSDDCSGLASRASSYVPTLGPIESSGDQSKPRGKGKGKGEKKGRKEEGTLHLLWSPCRQLPDIMTNFLPGGHVSVGRIVRCPSPSRHALVELVFADGSDCVSVLDPIPTSRIQNLC